MNKYVEESALCKFRTRMMGDSPFINYGITLDGVTPPDMLTANLNMITWIIKELNITKDSNILEIGSGRGGYLLEIAEQTGCTFTGVDILPHFVEEANRRTKKRGLEKFGKFVQGSFQTLAQNEKCRQNFTHILSLASLYYAHKDIDVCLSNIAEVANKDSKILVWDFNRVKDWKNCSNFYRHMKTEQIASQSEMIESVIKSDLRVNKMEDLTSRMVPCLKILRDAALEDDPISETLTFPYVYNSFLEGEVVYPAWILSKR